MKYLGITTVLFLLFLTSYAQKVGITTSLGEIVVELDSMKAPVTVANFLKHVEGGFYEGGSFFRTVHEGNQPTNPVKITVIQGGASAMMQSVLFDAIPLERTNETGLQHKDGTISMARSNPDSAKDSFFICIDDQPELDFNGKRNPDGQGFAAFGQVIEGMEVVRKINEAPSDGQALLPPISILTMEVLD